MTPLRILFFGLVAVAVLLYVLNPGPEKFETFLRQDLAERAQAAAVEASGGEGADVGGGMGSFLAERIGREIGGAASHAFEREDYYLASVYRVDLNGPNGGGEWAFLGVANWFIPIEQPEAVENL
ncbi:MAG TPA: hypothetical protein VF576_02595 [Rubricoccaceae bacterium]|jgi:hypothetical protein